MGRERGMVEKGGTGKEGRERDISIYTIQKYRH